MPYLPDFHQTRYRKDPAPNWRWVVRMPDLDFSAGSADFPTPYTGLLRTSTIPFGMVNSIEFTVRQIDSDARFRAGSRYNFPRFMTVPSVQITFYEDVQYNVMRYLRSWNNLIVDEKGNYGTPSLYKKSIYFYAFDYLSNQSPAMVGIAKGCWSPSIGGLSYNYDSSGPVLLSAEFLVDEDIVIIGGQRNLSPSLLSNTGPFGQIKNAINTVRNVADNVRNIANQIQQPIRQVKGLIDEGRGAVQDLTGTFREIGRMPQNTLNSFRTTGNSFNRTSILGI